MRKEMRFLKFDNSNIFKKLRETLIEIDELLTIFLNSDTVDHEAYKKLEKLIKSIYRITKKLYVK